MSAFHFVSFFVVFTQAAYLLEYMRGLYWEKEEEEEASVGGVG